MPERVYKWYTLRAISGKEEKIKEYIEAEINSHSEDSLIAKNVSRVLIPTTRVPQTKDGKVVVVEHLLLSGYVLVEVALSEEVKADKDEEAKTVRRTVSSVLPKDVAAALRNVPNVLGFLCKSPTSLEPVPLRKSEIDRLVKDVDEEIEQPIGAIPFAVGDPVKVTSGPFNGFTGVVGDVNEDKGQLEVIVKIFERETPLKVDFRHVEKSEM